MLTLPVSVGLYAGVVIAPPDAGLDPMCDIINTTALLAAGGVTVCVGIANVDAKPVTLPTVTVLTGTLP